MLKTIETIKDALSGSVSKPLEIEGFRDAAVLVPLLKTDKGLELLFTVRSSQLSSHAGQISFPGGRLDEGEDFVEAALRESFEEVGMQASTVEVLGQLDLHPSPARYVVTPIVGVVEPQEFVLNEAEVEEVFTVGLEEIKTIVPYSEDRHLNGYSRRLYYYPYQERVIWGLTGNVIKNLLDVMAGVSERPWEYD